MSLVLCPECSHEVSLDAVACPNCGFPMAATTVVEERAVVVPPVKRKSDNIPMWAWVPVGVLALIVVFLFIFMLSGSEDDANVNLAVNARRPATTDSRDVRTETVPSTDVTVPSTDTTVSVPSTTTTTIPSSDPGPVTAPAPTRGKVVINAKVVQPRQTQPSAARGAKFYLLDKDIETILSEADVEPIEGNTLAGSLGLAAVYPDRYSEFMREAMRAIARHSKYSGTTDTAGQASLGNITPGEYYLYGLTRIGRGFALWNAPVSVTAGDNLLNLSPQSVTEIPDTTG